MDGAWDDPSPPIPLNRQPKHRSNLPEVSTEKSAISLSKLYENDYTARKEDSKPFSFSTVTPEIASLWDQVSQALDVLSGFQFASAADAMPMATSQSTLPSFSMNDIEKGAAVHAASLATSNASSHTPEEVKRPLRTPLKSSLERDSSKTEHQRTKRLQKMKMTKISPKHSVIDVLSKQKVS